MSCVCFHPNVLDMIGKIITKVQLGHEKVKYHKEDDLIMLISSSVIVASDLHYVTKTLLPFFIRIPW